jgi:membrane protease YdiL (CAAX protease family)
VTVVIGVVIAAAGWGAMFAAGRRHFWTRAAVAGAAVAIYAVAVEPHVIGHLLTRPRWELDLALGVASGVALFVIFWIGEQLLVIVLPTLAAEVGDLYAVRGETRPAYVPLILAIAGPGEELFFRGLIQQRAGFALALVVYAGVHLWERKVILVVAALIGGLYWGALLSLTGGLVAPIVSHLVWAMLIIVWRPARPTARAERIGGRVRAALRARRRRGGPGPRRPGPGRRPGRPGVASPAAAGPSGGWRRNGSRDGPGSPSTRS